MPGGWGGSMHVVRVDFGPGEDAAVKKPRVEEAADTRPLARAAPAPHVPWEGSDRRERLPDDWEWRRAETFRVHGDTCHVCKESGADEVDHVERGDDHRLENLRPIHSWRTPQRCHVFKTAREAAAAKARLRRPPEKHPGLL